MIIEAVEVWLASLKLQPTLLNWIKEAQRRDPESGELLDVAESLWGTQLNVDKHGVIRFDTKLWVLDYNGLRKEVLIEAHSSAYSVYPESTKCTKI